MTSAGMRSAQRKRAVVEAAASPSKTRSLGAVRAARAPARGRSAQQIGAHHRRRRQRDDQRDHDRDRQRHRELAEQPPDDAAHQQDRQEDRDQREAHRQHGEADLARAVQRRLHARHAGFDVARDVLQHDDRVVDDEAGRDRQRHQRQIVEAVAEQIHRRRRCRSARPAPRRSGSGSRAQLRRNRKTTRMTSTIAMISVRSTSCSEARIVVVRSIATVDVDGARERGLAAAAAAP